MSSFAEMYDVLLVARSVFIGKAKDVVAVLLRSPETLPDDEGAPTETETEEVEWWQHYGFISRPPVDAEVLKLNLGRFVVGIASRVLATAGVYGQLKDGDVGLYSVGKQVLRLNADGSVSLLKLTKAGKHLVVTITKTDEIKLLHPDGAYVEISKAGIVLKHDTAPVTISSGVKVQIIAPQLVNMVGVNMLHVGASTPLVPTSAAPNVFI